MHNFTNHGQTPVFAAWKPAFLGLVEEINLSKGLIDAIKGETRIPKKRVVAYLHGKLEDMAGFDIPVLLSGTVTEEKEQQCVVVLPDGKEQGAVMLLKDELDKMYGLITLEDDKEQTLQDLQRA